MVRLFSFFRAASVNCVGSDPQAVFIPHGGAARRGGPTQGAAGWALGAVVVAALRRGLMGLSLVALALALFLGSAALTPALAQEGSGSGQVQRIDEPNKKITLKHGAIADLDLPAMTLVYLIEPVLLEGIAPGDNVRFTARRNDQGQYLIIQIRKR